MVRVGEEGVPEEDEGREFALDDVEDVEGEDVDEDEVSPVAGLVRCADICARLAVLYVDGERAALPNV